MVRESAGSFLGVEGAGLERTGLVGGVGGGGDFESGELVLEVFDSSLIKSVRKISVEVPASLRSRSPPSDQRSHHPS